MITDESNVTDGANDPRTVAVNVGNTHIGVASLAGSRVLVSSVFAIDAEDTALARIRALAEEAPPESAPVVVIASVHDAVARRITASLQDDPAMTVDQPVATLQMGVDLVMPMRHALGENHTTGMDRFLAALAAFDAMKQACAVVDAGTAITVDFVDGEGVYHGGVIAPGLEMSLRALHEHTAQLPLIRAQTRSEEETFPKSTKAAMQTGVSLAACGLVRIVVERFAERFGAYPKVVATGGDAEMLFGDDPFVDKVAPDLVLQGIGLARLTAMGLFGASAAASRETDEPDASAGLSAL